MHPATITAIIPTYNRAQYISESIDSILQQTRPVTEILVIDDGSTDNTAEVVKSYKDKVRYIYQANAGPSTARNLGLQLAKGEYIAFQDSDDIWVKNKIEVQLDLFEKYPHLEFAFADMANFSNKEENTSPEIKNIKLHNYLIKEHSNLQFLFDWLITENVIPTGTVVFKRNIIKDVGLFDTSLKIAEDYKYWLQISSKCKTGFTPEVLLLRRRHEDNLINDITARNLALIKVLTETATPLAVKDRKLLRIILEKKRELNYNAASQLFKEKKHNKAHRLFRQMRPPLFKTPHWILKLTIGSILNTNKNPE